MRSTNAENIQQVTWVGIDVAKDSYDAAIYLPLESGEKPRNILELPKKHFDKPMESIEEFRRWTVQVREKAGLQGGKMRIVMEATGRYSVELAILFRQEMPFTEPVILNPKVVSDYRKSLYPGNDTDAIAAAALARFGAERHPDASSEIPQEYKTLRELTRQRQHMVTQRTTENNRFKEIKDIPVVAELQRSVIATLDKAIKTIELEIKKSIEKSDELRESVAYITSIKGIGITTAAAVLAECGPLINYHSRQLSAYSGLSPFNHRSGTSINSTNITRKGPKQLRQALYTPMTCLLKYNSEMRAFRQRLLGKGLSPMQARCAIMRKVLILIRALVVNKTFYQENFHKNISIKS